MKVKDWMGEWLDNYIKTTSKERTYISYASLVRNHIVPELGTYDLQELTSFMMQQHISNLIVSGNKITGEGLSASTVNLIISILQKSIRTAHELGLISIDVTDKLQRPKITGKKVECFSASEQKKLERYVIKHNTDKEFGILLCLYTGLRIGELLALEWTDIDFMKGLIYVSKTCRDGRINGSRTRIIGTPKTKTSNRIIPIPQKLRSRLREIERRGRRFVISDERRPVFLRSYQKLFQTILKKLNLPHRGFHSLRHTFATRALECGMDVKTLAEILGHKNPAITLNLYAHSLMEHKIAMMNRLGELL